MCISIIIIIIIADVVTATMGALNIPTETAVRVQPE